MSSTAARKASPEAFVLPARRYQGRLALGAAAIILLAALFAQGNPLFSHARRKLQASKATLGRQNLTKLHSILVQHGMIGVENAGQFPSTVAAEQLASDGLPTISVATEEAGLYDPSHGILAHPQEKGRAWERPAYVSYFKDGQLTEEIPAGLRVHGGISRKRK